MKIREKKSCWSVKTPDLKLDSYFLFLFLIYLKKFFELIIWLLVGSHLGTFSLVILQLRENREKDMPIIKRAQQRRRIRKSERRKEITVEILEKSLYLKDYLRNTRDGSCLLRKDRWMSLEQGRVNRRLANHSPMDSYYY